MFSALPLPCPPTTRDLLAMLSSVVSGCTGSGGASLKDLDDLEDAMKAIRALTPETPQIVLDAQVPSLEAPIVHVNFELLLTRLERAAEKLGWNLEQPRRIEVSTFGSAPMLLGQACVCTPDGTEKIRLGLRLLGVTAPGHIGAAHLALEIARDEPDNGLLPGKPGLVLLEELAKFPSCPMAVEALAAHPDLARVLAVHYAGQLGAILEQWPSKRLEKLLNDVLSA